MQRDTHRRPLTPDAEVLRWAMDGRMSAQERRVFIELLERLAASDAPSASAARELLRALLERDGAAAG